MRPLGYVVLRRQVRGGAFTAPPRILGRAPLKDAGPLGSSGPSLGGGLRTRRFLVLRDPCQRGLDVSKLARCKSFNSEARCLGLFLGEFGGRNGVYPHQTAAHLSRELLLLLFGHRSST